MRLPNPKWIIALGAVTIVVIAGMVVRERQVRRDLRRLPSGAVELSADERRSLEEKVARFSNAIAADATDFNAHIELALAKADLGDRDGAAEVYRQMNQRFPGNYLSFNNLGKLYEDAGRYPLAAEQYLLAVANDPRNPHLYRNVVNLYTYHLTERKGEIPSVLQRGLAVMPGSADLLSMLAVYYRDVGDLDQAIAIFEQMLVFDQENAAVLNEVRELKAKRNGNDQNKEN